MTSAALLQRAAELIVAFGLEHTGMTARDIRDSVSDSGLVVLWRLPSERNRSPHVELVVHRRTDRIEVATYVVAGGLGVVDAKRVAELYGRVVELAERIEALR
jgi:hypothetical protein